VSLQTCAQVYQKMQPCLRRLLFAPFIAVFLLLASCATGTREFVSSPEPATQSPAEAYPAPYPTLSPGGAILAGCPNPAGLQELPGVTEETAVALLTDFRSGDIDRARDVSDPGIWPIIPDLPPSPVQPEVAWLDGSPYPASHSPYAEAIANQCGEPLLKMSWAFTICDPACNVSHSQSLEEEYFVLSRADHLLIWTLWP
jgi:hypothetical protein